MVPTPTPIASISARTRWACRSAHADVRRVGRPGAAAMKPSWLIAAFMITNGPALSNQREERLIRARWPPPGRARPRPARRAADRKANPWPLTRGFGSIDRGDDAQDARLDDADDAGPGAAQVAAGLERRIQRAAARPLPGHVERVHFGVRFAGAVMVPVADHDAVARHDDRADHRVGAGPAAAALRRERARGPCSRDRSARRPWATTFLRTARRRTPAPRTARGRRSLRRRRRIGSAA